MQEEEIFKTTPERAQFSQEDREKDKKQYKVNTKVLTKISFHSPPTFPSIHFFLPKRFPEIISHRSRINAQQKNKKKNERRGEERKQKETVETAVSLFNSKSAHALTLEAGILHLEQKATKCKTCKQVFGKV